MPRGFQTEHGPRREDSAGRAWWGGPASPKSPEVPAPAGVGPQSRRGWKGLEADGPRSVFTLLSPTLTSSSGALAARGFYGTEAPWGLSSRGPPGVLVPGTSWGSRTAGPWVPTSGVCASHSGTVATVAARVWGVRGKEARGGGHRARTALTTLHLAFPMLIVRQ